MQRNTSFRTRQFLTLLAIAVLPLLLVLGIALSYSRIFVIERSADQLEIVADLTSIQVNVWLRQGKEVAYSIAADSEIKLLLPSLFSSFSIDSASLSTTILETSEAYSEIRSISLLHPSEGRVLLSTDPYLVDRIWILEDFYRGGQESLFVSPVFYSVGRESTVMNISTPIWNETGDTLLAVAVVEMDLSSLEANLSSRAGLGETGRAYLVDAYGFYIIPPPSLSTTLLHTIAESQGVERAVNGQNGIDNYFDPNGLQVLGVYRWLPDANMGLLVEIDEAELTSDYTRKWMFVLAAELVIVVLAAWLARSLAKWLVTPLENIAIAAGALKSGNLGVRAPLGGPHEIGQLAESFNEMAAGLQRSHEDLESLVGQRTEALEQSEAKLNSIVKTAPNAIISLDFDLCVIMFNDAAESMFKCSAEPALGEHINSFLSEDFLQTYPEVVARFTNPTSERQSKINMGRELNARRWDGDEFRVEASISKVEIGDQRLLTVILRDITERLHREKQIRDSLTEKEILLKEIHHRIKNNLQIIASLLYLQSKNLKNQDSMDVLKESQSRIKSMALIHESLYQSADFSSIDFMKYVTALGKSILKTYGRRSNKVSLKVNSEIEALDLDKFLPLGLIMNELISNALKHGILKDSTGSIQISLQNQPRGKYTLLVSDDGIGMPPDFDLDSAKTLGLHLVSNLVNQLDGEFEIINENGTQFKITFDEG